MRPLLPAFRRSLGQIGQDGPFPRFLPQPERSLTGPPVCQIFPAKAGAAISPCKSSRDAGTRTACDLAPPTAPGQDRPNGFGLKGCHPSPPLQGPTVDNKECIQIAAIKKRAPASLEPVRFLWSGWRDLNARPQRPERCALAKLSHIPLQEGTLHRTPVVCKLFSQKFSSPNSVRCFCPSNSRAYRQTFCIYQAIRL